MNKIIIRLIAAVMTMLLLLCGCTTHHATDKTAESDKKTLVGVEEKTEIKEKTNTHDTLPKTIDTYAKTYTEVGEILPSKSMVADNAAESPVELSPADKEGLAVYNSELGYSLEYSENYTPKHNYDGKDFIIIDEKSGSNLSSVVIYPNILYESEESYRKATENNEDMFLKNFTVREINGVSAVEIEFVIKGATVYQTVYRTGTYYYVLSYVQGRGVTLAFDKDMKQILSSLKAK